LNGIASQGKIILSMPAYVIDGWVMVSVPFDYELDGSGLVVEPAVFARGYTPPSVVINKASWTCTRNR
jgi:hypothetical protein